MQASIDREGCISCGLCPSICPEVFRMAEDGRAEVYANPSDAVADLVREAVESCPVQVIEAAD